MKEVNQKKLDDAIKALNKLGIENKDIMILGSIALDIVGLFPLNRHEAHDVDVMIKCSEEKEHEIKKLVELLNLSSENDKITTSDASSTIMKLKNVIINVWFVKPDYKFNTLIKLDNGVSVERPIDCINKKKQYGRLKDYKDLKNIVFQIL